MLVEENNIFHHYMSSVASGCFELMRTGRSIFYTSPQGNFSSAQKWMGYVLNQTCGAQPSAKKLHFWGSEHVLTRQDFDEVETPYLEFSTEIAVRAPLAELRRRMHGTFPPGRPRSVLLLLRDSRHLVDTATGTAQEIVDALCALGLPVEVANLGKVTPAAQVALMSRAAVTIAAHGADLTNILWMQAGTQVVEVVIRRGWCQDPVPLVSQGAAAAPEPENAPCVPYHKADYANLAQGLGLRYAYVDVDYLNPPSNANPISRDALFVNSTKLAMQVLFAFKRQQQLWEIQPVDSEGPASISQ